MQFGPHVSPRDDLQLGTLVGIRFASRVCHRCEYCTSGREQHCTDATNHLHHEDGSFQQYCVLDTKYLTPLPQEVDPRAIGPALCAGVTAYKASLSPPSQIRADRKTSGRRERPPQGGRMADRRRRRRGSGPFRRYAGGRLARRAPCSLTEPKTSPIRSFSGCKGARGRRR